ncbi:FkbM family methyltransferase [Marinobacter halophilus]|uniref:Methyltransferase FkbM domain-containing protein n=1 Tax=Marinobacter halophilus TaxID=1323740 RepID=A0A2T1KG47_9GAMM|nr:FkbM family methyltransferase [Marinobacter halophilus]PSF09104.1 hypothetical protein C7H08_05785 [Marinobacter halophilus]GGC83348.1 methyltransferase [Marinobacter halophilus]
MQPFGSRKPSNFLARLIQIFHNASAPFFSRILAPIVRKLVTKNKQRLPIDISVDGINLRCQFTDNYSEKKFVFTPWRYDLEERKLLSGLLANGGNFIDIGANVGLYTLTAAKAMIGQPGRIIAIEPNPPTLKRLNDNLLFNLPITKDRVTVLSIGVADREGSFDLYIDTSNLGASSISDRNRSKSNTEDKDSVSIRCLPLIDILDQEAIDAIRALKIDIEGAEDKALIPFLDQCKASQLPDAIFIENSEHLWSSDLFSEIIKKGYSRKIKNRMNSVFVRNN